VRGFLYLLIILGVAYFLYTHQDLWHSKVNVNAVPAAPYAAKVLMRNNGSGQLEPEVVVVSGDLWRVEFPTKGNIAVALYDGIRAVSNTGAPAVAATLDPHQLMNPLLAMGERCRTDASFAPNDTEVCDEHTCWKVSTTSSTYAGQVWIDTKNFFPVYAVVTMGGRAVEAHFTKIPIDFSAPGTAEFFDAGHKEAIFGKFLK
jgi:hypothetical protein